MIFLFILHQTGHRTGQSQSFCHMRFLLTCIQLRFSKPNFIHVSYIVPFAYLINSYLIAGNFTLFGFLLYQPFWYWYQIHEVSVWIPRLNFSVPEPGRLRTDHRRLQLFPLPGYLFLSDGSCCQTVCLPGYGTLPGHSGSGLLPHRPEQL